MSDFKEKLRYLLYRCRLGTLVRNLPTSKEWSEKVNEQLHATGDTVEIIDAYTAIVGNLVVWIENYPYAYGCPYAKYITTEISKKLNFSKEGSLELSQMSLLNHAKYGQKLPDRRTVYLLHRAVERARAAL